MRPVSGFDALTNGLKRIEALLFGSMGSLLEASALQRECYNEAIRWAGINGLWSRAEYAELLAIPRGTVPVQNFATRHGRQDLTAELSSRIKHRMVERFSSAIKAGKATVRPGVSRLVQEASTCNLLVGLTTTFERQTMASRTAASDRLLDRMTFDVIVERKALAETKPGPVGYRLALGRLDVTT